MDKIAIISDIHGNLEALNSVFKDIKERHIDKIFCLGDIVAKGTHQEECVKLIKDNCEVVLKGNCDVYFASKIDRKTKTEIELKRIDWIDSKLSNESKAFLKSLPYSFEFFLSGRLVRLFHATPEKINGFIGNIDTIERLYSLFLPSENTVSNEKADIVVYGHIHTPFMQKIYNRTIINAGSVGNAIDVFRNIDKDANVKNTTIANYVILSGKYDSKDINEKISFEMVNVPYDIEKELSKNTDNIEKDLYEEELRSGKYRNMEKIYKSFELRGIDINKI